MHDNLELLTRFLVDQYAFPMEDVSLLSKFKQVNARRNQLLLSAGEVCRHVYFICKGCVRTYFIDKAGMEKTRFLAFENNFVTSFASFIRQTSSTQYVQALEEVTVLRIGHRDFYKLVDNKHDCKRKVRGFTGAYARNSIEIVQQTCSFLPGYNAGIAKPS